MKGVRVGLRFRSHPHTSSGDLQGRRIGVTAAAQPGSGPSLGRALRVRPHLPLRFLLPQLQHFPKETLKLDTSVERSGGLFKITSQAVLVLCLLSKGGGELKRDKAWRLKLTWTQTRHPPRP